MEELGIGFGESLIFLEVFSEGGIAGMLTISSSIITSSGGGDGISNWGISVS
jgi:hypothetical protein